jgi:hypothetical protein
VTDPIDKAQRGLNAQKLLENELFKEVLNELDGEYHRRWRNAETVEAREDLFRYVKVLEHVTKDIRQIAVTGALEEQRIAALEAKRKLAPLNEWAIEERS